MIKYIIFDVMNTPHKFVSPLNESQIILLEDLIKNNPSHRVRIRSHSILLSSKGFSIDEIAFIYDVYRDSVSSWIDGWEKEGVESLYDRPRCGAPAKLTESDIETVKKIINGHPHSPKIILAEITAKINKTVSMSTLKRIIKKAGLRWKRTRKSVKKKRDKKEFETAEKEIKELKEQCQKGIIDLFYFDESGFSCDSQIPYAYQPTGETLEINISRSKRLNISGFLSPSDNRLQSFSFACNIDSEITVKCFDVFSEIITKKTVVILDNSSVHHSRKFRENIGKWEKKGLFLKYLPPYSPELNLIEILWRFIKYHWLPFSAYLSFTSLAESVEDILKNFGTSYQINFT